jgi:hypothetical protein
MSEIVLSRLKTKISAHCNESPQNRWIFTISPNTGGYKYFPHKCGGFFGINSSFDTGLKAETNNVDSIVDIHENFIPYLYKQATKEHGVPK